MCACERERERESESVCVCVVRVCARCMRCKIYNRHGHIFVLVVGFMSRRYDYSAYRYTYNYVYSMIPARGPQTKLSMDYICVCCAHAFFKAADAQ